MKPWLKQTGWQFWAMLTACLLLVLALFHPTLPLKQPVHRYLFVIDITQSMNAQDYHVDGLPADRLGFVKATLHRVIGDLPCGSEVGLGLFTTRNAQILFEPLEICRHFPVIDDVLEHIDWRMAWAANSFIDHGLYSALREIAQRDPGIRLVFLTDGQAYPADADSAVFHGQADQVKGWVIGVGGLQPVPIPKLDQNNQPQGYWEYADLENYVFSGDPSGQSRPEAGLYLSRLDETNLRNLASLTGLGYYRLQTPEGLEDALRSPELAEQRQVKTDLRGVLAALALLLFIVARFGPLTGK